ncbi:hypothetical protein RHGRI_022587 [Rhododendron griersonianum]|uniref:Kelch repeat type 1 n=1 Tax=Rhododendron griersonianum TaxID=479676 RepID=A0AAV6J3Z9_9ERIC|nr:hypothetical protein RHGRI_022587 [Rhododendron griersonianum]
MESFGAETEEGAKNRNLYLFYQDVSSNHALHVYAIDSSSLLMYPVTKLPRGNSCDMGCIAHGSKLYAIGGVFRDSHAQGYPRDVFVCDLSKRKGRKGDHYKWKAGPALNAGKPYPMVVAVKGKIYALAGEAYRDVPAATDPTFEFLDHRGVWHPLPEPPFYSRYSALLCYTVGGNIIYVLVEKRDGNEVVELLYSFNVLKKKWKVHPRGVLCGDRVGDNLSSHKWLKWADLEDGKLYLSDTFGGNCRLYAHDLITSKKKKIVNEIVCEIHDGLPVSWDVERYLWCGCINGVPYVRLRVKLLRALEHSNQSIVAHVGNRMLLVVCAYNPPRKFPDDGRFVYTCLLKLVKVEDNTCKASCSEKWRDCAVIVKQQYHKMNRLFDQISAWSTM